MSVQQQIAERHPSEERITCYSSGSFGSAATSLRIIMSDGQSWLLPWHRFLHARLDGDRLVLVFAERRVEVRGRNLGLLFEKYIADYRLTMIRELPAEYVTVAGGRNDAFITEIQVLEPDADT